jgi:outer membrane protein assembly factor BamD
MFKSYLTALALAIVAITFPCKADAWLWGLFGHDDKWRMLEPAEQDVEAQKLMERANHALSMHKDKKAMKYFIAVYEKFPASKYTAEALFNTGKIQLRRQEWGKAFVNYSVLLKAYPENKHFDEVVSDMFDIAYSYETGRNIYYCGFVPYKDRGRAVAVYQNIVDIAPYNDIAPTCLMRIAVIHYEASELVSAIASVDRIINDYPNSLEAPDATMFLADLMSEQVQGPAYDQGATNEAINYYRDFMTLYPTNPAVNYCEGQLAENRERYAQSRLLVGEFFYNYRDDYDSASVFFNDSITNAPDSKAATQARDYLDKIAKIKERFPNGDWPRRTEWQYLRLWHKWDPLTEPVKRASSIKKPASEEKPNSETNIPQTPQGA